MRLSVSVCVFLISTCSKSGMGQRLFVTGSAGPIPPTHRYCPPGRDNDGLAVPRRRIRGGVLSDIEQLTLRHKIASGTGRLKSRIDPVVSVEGCRTAVPCLKQIKSAFRNLKVGSRPAFPRVHVRVLWTAVHVLSNDPQPPRMSL